MEKLNDLEQVTKPAVPTRKTSRLSWGTQSSCAGHCVEIRKEHLPSTFSVLQTSLGRFGDKK